VDWQNRPPGVSNREIVAAALRSEGLRSRVPRLAGVSSRELTERLSSERFYADYNAAIEAAWAAAHGGLMPDGSDAEATITAIRERLDRQRTSDYRRAHERQEREEARRQAAQLEADQGVAEQEKVAMEAAAEATPIDAAKDRPPAATVRRSWDQLPWLVRAVLVVFGLITWPLFRPILKTSPGWPRVITAVLYWGWIAFMVVFLIRLA
jgi:hypothetical protein